MKSILITISSLIIFSFTFQINGQCQKAKTYGLNIGVMKPGKLNAITDVAGVLVGHKTLIRGKDVRTGVTAILPHGNNVFLHKVPAAIYVGNGFGKLTGISQVQELGNIETPIVLTNTLSIPTAVNAIIKYTLALPGLEEVRSVNSVVGETNDGYINDIRGLHVKEKDVLAAIRSASKGPVQEGNVGAGTGTRAFGLKGGIGTASRILPQSLGGYTIGVLVQSNFGGILTVDGLDYGEQTLNYPYHQQLSHDVDGSCMIVVATDAPILSRNLERLAKRAMIGLGKTGGIVSNGSGDYVIAFSTYQGNQIKYNSSHLVNEKKDLPNSKMTPLFMAVIEATEEAIINSLLSAKDMQGNKGRTLKAIDKQLLLKLIRERK